MREDVTRQHSPSKGAIPVGMLVRRIKCAFVAARATLQIQVLPPPSAPALPPSAAAASPSSPSQVAATGAAAGRNSSLSSAAVWDVSGPQGAAAGGGGNSISPWMFVAAFALAAAAAALTCITLRYGRIMQATHDTKLLVLWRAARGDEGESRMNVALFMEYCMHGECGP